MRIGVEIARDPESQRRRPDSAPRPRAAGTRNPSEGVDVPALQRAAGNRAVARLMSGSARRDRGHSAARLAFAGALQRVWLNHGVYGRMKNPDSGEAVRVAKVIEDGRSQPSSQYHGTYSVEGALTHQRVVKQGIDLGTNYAFKVDEFAELGFTKEYVQITAVTAGSRDDYADQVYKARRVNGEGITVRNTELTQNIGRVATPANKESFTADVLGRTKALLYIPDEYIINTSPQLVFRGDDRPPTTIFQSGFSPRELHRAPIFRTSPRAGQHQYDIAPQTGVSVSHSPEAAALFPINVDSDTYLYAVSVDQFIDTGRLQRDLAKKLPAEEAEHIRSLLFARELTLGRGAQGAQVIAAVKVSRKWVTPDHVVFTQGPLIENAGHAWRAHPRYERAIRNVENRMRIREWERDSTSDLGADAAGDMRQRLTAERELLTGQLSELHGIYFDIHGRDDWIATTDRIIARGVAQVAGAAGAPALKTIFTSTLQQLRREEADRNQ
jgi:hypothetical protein